MKTLRRSQQLYAQPSGQQNAYPQNNGLKRKDDDRDPPQNENLKRYRLTAKNLSALRKQERDIGKIRKIPSSNSKASTTTTTTTATTATTDRQFGPNLIQNGVVFHIPLTIPPSDYDMVTTALAKDRELPSSAHRQWQYMQESQVQMALGELSLESTVVEAMLIHHNRPTHYGRFRHDQWTEVENEITAGISDPKPDVTEAYLWTVYPPGTKEEFEELVPTQYGYAMPTFAMESKGVGDPGQAVKQAAYDGAIMTQAALAVERQMGKDDASLYLKTKAITVTLNPEAICVYANHAVKDQSSGKISYHHHRVKQIPYLDSEEDWNSAYSVLHNAQAFALTLADSRIEDIEKYFEQKELRLREMKAKNNKLQVEARSKVKEVMPSQFPEHISEAKTSKPIHRNAGKTAPSVGNKIDKLSKLPASTKGKTASKVEHMSPTSLKVKQSELA